MQVEPVTPLFPSLVETRKEGALSQPCPPKLSGVTVGEGTALHCTRLGAPPSLFCLVCVPRSRYEIRLCHAEERAR